MTNIFKPMGIVSEDSMIGYENYYNMLKGYAFIQNQSCGISVSGMHQVGKSSLMQKLYDEAINKDGFFPIYIDLAEIANDGDCSRMFSLIKTTANNIKRMAIKLNLSNEIISEYCKDILAEEVDGNIYRMNFKDLIEEIGESNHLIYIIDEFDSAREFEVADDELLRTLMSYPKYNCTIFLVSRAQIQNIVADNRCNSWLPQAVKKEYIHGFSKEDIHLFYSKLEEYNITLSEDEKKTIYKYAGIIPKWYSEIGFELVEQKYYGNIISVEKVCQSKSSQIYDYYDTVFKRLDKDGYINDIYATVVGVQTGVSKQRVSALETIGYLSADKYNSDRYISFSPYFSTFLPNKIHKYSSEIETVLAMERKIKGIVADQLKRYGIDTSDKEAYEKILKKSYLDNGSTYNPGNYARFIENTERDFRCTCTLLDVMSLKDTLTAIVSQLWSECFSQYFGGDLFSQWEIPFSKCSMARNPLAHGHKEFLSEEDRRIIVEYCRKIINTIDSNVSTVKTSRLSRPDWLCDN